MENIYPYLVRLFFWDMVLLFFTVSSSAQEPNIKQYTPDLDSLWSREVYIMKMTTDGNWVVLQESFDLKEPETILHHTTKEYSFVFKGAQFVNFSDNDEWFGCISSDKKLQVINLKFKTLTSHESIFSYEFSKSGNYIVAHQKASTSSDLKTFLLINLRTNTVEKIEHVKAIKLHPKADKLLLLKKEVEGYKLTVRNLENTTSITIAESYEGNYDNFQWSTSGNHLVFMERLMDRVELNYFNLEGKHIKLRDEQLASKFNDYATSDKFLGISENGMRVVFYRKSLDSNINDNTTSIEVWDTDEVWIAPKMKKYKRDELSNLLTVWYPEEGTLKAIETEELPSAVWDINQDFAIVYDKLQYEPLYKNAVNVDLYVRDIEQERNYLVTSNQYTESSFVSISTCGNYIAYFKGRDWYLYAVKKGTTVNLTQSIDDSFINVDKDFAGDKSPYGSPGWIGENEQIVIYDKNDIWLMAANGSYKERITRGKEENLQYRISQNYQEEAQKKHTIRNFFIKKNYVRLQTKLDFC